MRKQSFKEFVEQELGSVPKFFIYALLEWVMIFMLFFVGFVAFIANEFARFFELPIPCLLCTRLDLLVLGRTEGFHYNESICDQHKKSVSCLAFCHAHKKLSDIRNLCEACLLSFATERETDCHRYKSLLGILHKDIDQLLVDEDSEVQFSWPAVAKKDLEPAVFEESNEHHCTCCGQPLKVKSSGSKGKISSLAPSASPRALPDNVSQTKYSELKLKSDEPAAPEESDRSKGEKPLKEDGKVSPKPMVPEGEQEDKTPEFVKNTKFFGIPLSDSANNSPRWTRTPRKLLLQKSEFALECGGDGQIPSSPRMDRKSLMALYMELDEERNASAVAAYNAMAMITRLQAEKAAVQMEALQYQRMMEEQAEYDQEALEEMINLVAKREDELTELDAELEVYRAKYGRLQETDFETHGQRDENNEDNVVDDDDNQAVKKPSLSSSNAKSEASFTTSTGEKHSESHQTHAESNSSNHEMGTDSDPPAVEKMVGEASATAKAKQAMRQLDRMKILEKKLHISSMGRLQKQTSWIDEEFEEEEEEEESS